MSKYLLSIALGPVQDFIAAARRTRDLAYGSFLLSENSKACARFLRDHYNATLIFPAPRTGEDDLQPGSPFMAVNKILVEVEAAGESAMREMAAACQAHVREYLEKTELRGAMQRGQKSLDEDAVTVNEDLARRHVLALSEFFAGWAIHEAGNYAPSREKAERRLAARKTLRNFAPHEGREGILKSSLDGFRESVLQRPKERSERQHFVRWDEQLDGVGLLKRFGGNRKHLTFESTMDVAAKPYVLQLEREHPQVLRQFEAFLHRNRQWLPSSYGYLYKHESRQVKDQRLSGELELLMHGVRAPETPYYGLLLGDGDGMGTALSGIKDLTGHKDFSRQLSEFALKAAETIEAHGGECVYTGGDDVMALLPLHNALDCAFAIREDFNGHMRGWNVTFSAGLAVAHAMEPLDEVRRMAEQAEKSAKRIQGKDALAVLVSPRSGVDVGTCGKWDKVRNGLQEIARCYNRGTLSKGLGHELRQLLERWRGDTEAEKLLDDALPRLAQAIGQKKEQKQEARALLANLETREELQFFVNNLFVARPFARAMKEAGKAQ